MYSSIKRPDWLWLAIGMVGTVLLMVLPFFGDLVTTGVTKLRDILPWSKKKQ